MTDPETAAALAPVPVPRATLLAAWAVVHTHGPKVLADRLKTILDRSTP